ncbi:HDIG domain-containing protein [Clostridiaceae bacterium M8S5]|nr:HDIG domain-containing protein [Clostridiaceae bacterium M8S5]
MLFKKHNIRKRLKSTKVNRFLKRRLIKQILLFVCFTIVLSGIFIFNMTTNKISAEVGDVARQDIVTNKDIVDKIETNRLREQSMDKVEPIYKFDLSVQVNVKTKINNFFDIIQMIRNSQDENKILQKELLKREADIELSDNDFSILLTTKKSDLDKLQSYIGDIIFQVMAKGIKEKDLEESKQVLIENFDKIEDLKDSNKRIGREIIVNFLKPNMFLDIKQTKEAKEAVAKQIEDIKIKKGQVIILKGEEFKKRHIALLRESGLLKEKNMKEYKPKIGLILLAVLIVCSFIVYLYYLNRKLLYNPKLLFMVMLIVIVILLLGKSVSDVSTYLVPIATATMLITILLDEKVSIFINLIMVIQLAYITNASPSIIVLYMLSGLVGAIGGKEANHRYKIFVVGLVVGLVNVFMSVSIGLILDEGAYLIVQQSIFGILNGVMCSVITVGSLPLWESVFGIITPQKLLDLSNPNTPIMKRLLLEAPGTYHHSIVVGNLSESAAEAINANALLARVGSYYHDIGKLKRPYFFKENQFNSANPHDKLKANLSTIVILNHVKDGVEMAKKYKLPKFIEDIIRQHHGRTLVAFFYHKALNSEKSESVREEDFRYPGPKPQTKEAAIIMLADSVEAAVRSIQEPTKVKIESLIKKIIKAKLEDGQLDESELTFKDLDIIANKFTIILLGIFHERIEYPKLNIDEIKGGI